MRKSIFYIAIICILSLTVTAQTGSTAKPATPAKKPAASTPAASAKKAAPAKPAAAAANPIAVFDTSAGKLTCTLFPQQAPKTVANFIGLANGTKEWKHPGTGATMTGKPLFDGTIFHRVIPNFMIQGGDPIGTGSGGPGYRFENENSPDLTYDRPGRLAMANAGKDTNGSQFFITEVPYPSLNGGYTIFGQCDDASVELVKKIARAATDPRNNRPDQPVHINHISITSGATPVKTVAPAAKKPAAGTPAKKPATTPIKK